MNLKKLGNKQWYVLQTMAEDGYYVSVFRNYSDGTEAIELTDGENVKDIFTYKFFKTLYKRKIFTCESAMRTLQTETDHWKLKPEAADQLKEIEMKIYDREMNARANT